MNTTRAPHCSDASPWRTTGNSKPPTRRGSLLRAAVPSQRNEKLRIALLSQSTDHDNLWLQSFPRQRCATACSHRSREQSLRRPSHVCTAAAVLDAETAPPPLGREGGKRRVLVLGGTGRVGGSTITALLKVRQSYTPEHTEISSTPPPFHSSPYMYLQALH